MPFPFLPGGAIVAASILIGALTLFGLILRAMDRAVLGIRDTAVSSIVAGLRGWTDGRPVRVALSSPSSVPPGPTGPSGPGSPEIVDLGSRPIEAAARR